MKYIVGETYKEFTSKNRASIMKFNGKSADIFLLFKAPSDETIDEIKNSAPFFQIYVKNNIIFLLIKFKKLDWIDVPYIQREVIRSEKIEDERFGYPVNIYLADINTGRLLTKRHSCFNHGLSKAFYYAIDSQLRNPPKNVLEKINSIRASFHSNEIARLSLGK